MSAIAESREYIELEVGWRYPVLMGDRGGARIGHRPRLPGLARIVLGNSSLQTDQYLPQIILASQQGGMGEDQYTETEGLSTFRISGWDTRYPALVLPPEVTSLGTVGVLEDAPRYLEATDTIAASLIIWGPGSTVYRRDSSTGAWTPIVGTWWGFCEFDGRYCYVNRTSVVYSSDGATWTTGAGLYGVGLCTHDNKIYTYDHINGYIRYVTDVTLPLASWAQSQRARFRSNEAARQLFEWRGERDGTRVYLLTTRRVFYLDDLTGAIGTFWDFGHLVEKSIYSWPRATVGLDGHLYITFYAAGDNLARSVYQLTGTTVADVGPNRGGGLPSTNQLKIISLVAGGQWTFAAVAGNDGGRVIARDNQGGWHTIYEPDATLSEHPVIGMGYADGVLTVAHRNGSVSRLAIPDVPDLPWNVPARRYRSGRTVRHQYAITDGGAPNLALRLYGFQIHARQGDGRGRGLDAGTSVRLGYRTDTGGNAWIYPAPALTAANAWPVVIPLNDGLGVACQEFDVLLEGSTSDPTKTPVITSVIAYFQPLPPARQEWDTTIDLRASNAAFGNAQRQFFGRTASQLKARLKEIAGLVPEVAAHPIPVPFRYGGAALGNGPNLTQSAAVLVQLQGTDDPHDGDGTVNLLLTDLTLPRSG